MYIYMYACIHTGMCMRKIVCMHRITLDICRWWSAYVHLFVCVYNIVSTHTCKYIQHQIQISLGDCKWGLHQIVIWQKKKRILTAKRRGVSGTSIYENDLFWVRDLEPVLGTCLRSVFAYGHSHSNDAAAFTATYFYTLHRTATHCNTL